MKLPVEEALKTGKVVEGAICYTGDILNPKETKYTIDYYCKKARQLETAVRHALSYR